jgi:hypothetical protein
MKTGRMAINELCHAAEGLSGTAAASALIRLGSLMQCAPAGRHFAAIATLADLSRQAASALEAGGLKLALGRDAAAAENLTHALSRMDDLAVKSQSPAPKPRRRAAR